MLKVVEGVVPSKIEITGRYEDRAGRTPPPPRGNGVKTCRLIAVGKCRDDAILDLFGSSPVKPLQQHMAKVVECVDELPALVIQVIKQVE